MPITITIKDKFVTDLLASHIRNTLHDNFADEALKKAKVPAAGKLAKSIYADEKFVAEFTKNLTEMAMGEWGDIVYATLESMLIPQLAKFVSACDQVEHDLYTSNVEAAEEQTINHMVRYLQTSGYVVTKAKAK